MSAVKSAERALQVLEYFASIRRPAAAKEVESALEIPQSSTSMLLRSLVGLGYLNYDAQHRVYFPTVRVASLGHWLEKDPQIAFFSSLMESLRDETSETVVMGGRMGNYIRYFHHSLPSNQTIQFFMPEGYASPLCTSASGRALLSRADDEDVAIVVRRHNLEARKGLRVDEKRVQEALALIRETGISETHTDLGGRREHHVIAAVAPSKYRDQLCSIAVGGPRVRILKQRDRITQVLLEHVPRIR